MSSGEIVVAEMIESGSATRPAGPLLRVIEKLTSLVTDRLNPILVKEARQALKSRQFVVTFTLLLLGAWFWTIFGVIVRMPEVYYTPSGTDILLGYYFVLAIPMLLIVPFTSFRSLASEQEDGTYELLSITTLSSRQIVTGKLGSAVLQMIVYYSALAPCMVFTYLLRGIDIISIALLLYYTFLASVLFSAVGLVFAGVSRSKTWNGMLSVVVLLTLVVGTFTWLAFVADELFDNLTQIPYDQVDFWIGNGVVLTAYVTYLVLFVQVAAAQNSFASDNKSTRIRITLFIQAALFVGWAVYGMCEEGSPSGVFAVIGSFWAAFHWFLYGAYLNSENPVVSPRVRRDLPQSLMGRAFLTWFNPGSGAGYMFAISTYGLVLLCLLVATYTTDVLQVKTRGVIAVPIDELAAGFALTWAYFVAYLGVGRLLLLAIPASQRSAVFLPVLVHAFLLLLGIAFPFAIEAGVNRMQNVSYSTLHATNWTWTLNQVYVAAGFVPAMVYLLVFGTAAVVLVINMVLATKEIEAVRILTPQRVLDERQEPAHGPQLPVSRTME